jgi:hypothetical protein
MKTKLLFMMMMAAAAIIFAGCSKDDDESTKTPPYAASPQTWAFGNLIWSDAIQMPNCDKEDFKDSDISPQGRSYTSGEDTYYYYNWPYVNANKAKMCPSPWRVPSSADIDDLVVSDISAEQIITSWGLGGFALGSRVYDVYSHLYLWGNGTTQPYFWSGYGDPAYDPDQEDHPGFQVRCVRDN